MSCANNFFTDFELRKFTQVIMQFQLSFESTSRYKRMIGKDFKIHYKDIF
jgi:hypothetical protein